jgi:hypothetical protein
MAEARARETALTEKKNTLTLEAQRLRQDLRMMQSEINDRFASREGSTALTTPIPEEER